jgi:polyvinyl alcohol dehydrogenase (cytochrome)
MHKTIPARASAADIRIGGGRRLRSSRITAVAASLGAVVVLATGFGLAAGGPAAHADPAAGGDKGGTAFANSVFNADDPAKAGRGGEVYAQRCAGCHAEGIGHAPQRAMFTFMSPHSIVRALNSGAMQVQGEGLTDADKVAVAEYLSGRKMSDAAQDREPPACKGAAARFDMNEPPVFANWGLSPGNTRFEPAAKAGISKANVGKLHLKWAVSFPNSVQMRSQPALAAGAIFLGSHNGQVYALDRATGCARWIYQAGSEVRTGIVISPWKAGEAKAKPLAFFGDVAGNVYALDALTGAQVWRKRAEPHPYATITGAPTLYDGLLYVPISGMEAMRAVDPTYECCKTSGGVVAYAAATGEEVWRTHVLPPAQQVGVNERGVKMFSPSGNSVWNSPAIDPKRHQLYIGTGPNSTSPATGVSDAIVAMDLKTGKMNWVYQGMKGDASNLGCLAPSKINCPKEDGPDYDFGAGAMLVKMPNGHDLILAGQKSGMLHAIDPDTGKGVWQARPGRGGILGGIQFSLASDGRTVFAPVNDAPNLRHDGKTYAEAGHSGLYAFDVATGKPLWSALPQGDTCHGLKDCNAGYSQAITMTPDLVFAGANDGWLRIFDARTGAVVWQVDTKPAVGTVNGGKASGGSFSGGAGPVLYHGVMYVSSGYNRPTMMAGNLLLAYEVK